MRPLGSSLVKNSCCTGGCNFRALITYTVLVGSLLLLYNYSIILYTPFVLFQLLKPLHPQTPIVALIEPFKEPFKGTLFQRLRPLHPQTLKVALIEPFEGTL